MRILIVLVTLIVPAALAAQSNPAPGQLAAAIEAELGQIPANTGLYLKHLKTGEEVAVRADVSFNSQSVIKIPIMVRAFQLAEQGKLNLDERVTIGRAELRDGSGVFQFADLGLAPTLRDLIQQMIITSDNTATDVMATKVGGVDCAQRVARGVGLQDAEDQPRLGVPAQAAGAARSRVPRPHRRGDHRPSVRRRRTIRSSRTIVRCLPVSARSGSTWCGTRKIAAAAPRIPPG